MARKRTYFLTLNASILLNYYENIATTTDGFTDCTLNYAKVIGSFCLTMNLGVFR
ncbi:hypothetical protein KM92CIT3_120034 [uncultured Citrobacter sp.]|uniref:Uncharacterized protein n=1 Tax=uncultured Citrobacter sp. TaxID=200446 RepID=A0A212I3E4_9ENTR|nr:protein of unknown function [Citrobacter amalonaticus]SBV61230.1 hypothetical protein KM92CIT3_120034 [uncultured Citrobacter sp.]